MASLPVPARYIAPLAAGQSVKVRTTDIAGIPSFLKGQVVTVYSYCAPCAVADNGVTVALPAISKDMSQNDIRTLATVPVIVKTADGKRTTLARGHLSSESSAL
jgi:hypothetical protein